MDGAGVISPEYGSGQFWDAEGGCYYIAGVARRL